MSTVSGVFSAIKVLLMHVNVRIRVYEAYYLSGPLKRHKPDDVAWIGSIQVFAMFSVGLFSGPLSDRIGPRVYDPALDIHRLTHPS